MPSPLAFSDEELRGTIASFPFAGVDADLLNPERFGREVARRVYARLSAYPDSVGSHSVFLLHPAIPDSLAHAERYTAYALDDGETDVTSGMWFVGPTVIRGVHLEAAATYDEMFPQVVNAGLGETVAVTYRSTSNGPVLRYYPRGLSEPEDCVRMVMTGSGVDLDQILALVDLVHSRVLVTPPAHQGGAKLWQNRSKRYPVRQVEVAIQAYLRVGLSVALPLCRINPEQNLVAGRLDLEVEELTLATKSVMRPAILELKVLRSFGSTGVATSKASTEKWISEGVDQAFAYRKERRAEKSALCCFDMRVNLGDDTCLKKVEDKAKSVDVVVRSWPIYPDLKQYRAAEVSAALSAGSPPAQT